MSTVKERMSQVIEDQPEDATYDDILRELALLRMVERGLADVDAGRTITHEEMGREIGSWRK